jgi:hypothetical protein
LFQCQLLKPYNIKSQDTDKGRFYYIGDDVYPSVTTVISKMLPADYLEEWKARVGEQEAQKILKQAGRRGTAVHKLMENYMMNSPIDKQSLLPVNLDAFKKLKKVLDEHVKIVYGVEIPLFSHTLKSAGRCDLIATWDDIDAIIDFKTSRYPKSKEDIYTYFIQLTAYAIMVYAIYKIVIKRIVILMYVDHEEPLIFVEEVKNYISDTVKLFKEYSERQDFNK